MQESVGIRNESKRKGENMTKKPEKIKVVVIAKAIYTIDDYGNTDDEIERGVLKSFRNLEFDIGDAEELIFDKVYVRRGRKTKYVKLLGRTLQEYVKIYGREMELYMIENCLTPASVCRVYAASWKGKLNPRTMESYFCRFRQR